jgi:hypothetical protein
LTIFLPKLCAVYLRFLLFSSQLLDRHLG